MKALSPKQALSIKTNSFTLSPAWQAAFGSPETCGTWFIWGQSGNGKSSFMVQLAKELCHIGKVLYNSLEEGFSLSFQQQLLRHDIQAVNHNLYLVSEDMEALKARLRKRRSPRMVIIDSLQYTGLSFEAYRTMVEEFPRHLFIFSCQARGNKPDGRTANRIMYDSMLKIWVEGYRAFSKGRFIGNLGYIDIWQEGAEKYWNSKQQEQEQQQ